MDKQLKISIIVPAYNAEKYLSKCLDSLLEQGIAKEDYEIICINDGSDDGSFAVMKRYADKYQNIVAIDKENEGVSAARNKGLEIARGEYVWFVDADDWIIKDFLVNGAIPKLFDETVQHIPLLLTRILPVYEGETEKYYDIAVTAGELQFEEVRPFMTSAVGHFLDRNILEKYHLRFNTNLPYGEDLMFMREFLDHIRFENEAGSNHRILQCNGQEIYFYRRHQASAIGQLRNRMGKVADSILYRARWSMQRYQMTDKPAWYTANYQEYVNLYMQEYMLYYFPALDKPMRAHLKELKKEGLYPAPPPKLGWDKPKGKIQRIQRFAFKHPAVYPLYYMIMRAKYKKAGSV